MSKIVLYGGTFNPPHCGHVHAAEAAAKELRPDRLIIMPAGIPPHKQLSPGTPAPEDRLRMAELAFGHIPGAVISDFEIRKTGKCYTVDTVEEICRREPGCAVTLLTGTDMFLTLQDWYRAERLLSLCSVAVVSRDSEDDPKTLSEQKRRLKKTFGTDVVILKTPPLPASSSEIRAVDPGNDPSVPAEVRAYILQRKLYGNTIPDPVIRHLRCAAEEVLSSERFAHTLRCRDEALRLSAGRDVDRSVLEAAALLHDITKECSTDDHLKLCKKWNIIIPQDAWRTPAVLHQYTGASVAEHVYGMPESVCRAIRGHTTGSADMNETDRILFLADLTEPGRTIANDPHVRLVREMAEKDTVAACIEQLTYEIHRLTESGREVFSVTLQACENLKESLLPKNLEEKR